MLGFACKRLFSTVIRPPDCSAAFEIPRKASHEPRRSRGSDHSALKEYCGSPTNQLANGPFDARLISRRLRPGVPGSKQIGWALCVCSGLCFRNRRPREEGRERETAAEKRRVEHRV